MDRRTLTTAADRRARAQDRMALKRFADAAADLEAALTLLPAGQLPNLRADLETALKAYSSATKQRP